MVMVHSGGGICHGHGSLWYLSRSWSIVVVVFVTVMVHSGGGICLGHGS